jgi:hypothetical protein
VPSSCSMNMAAPTIRAMVRKWGLASPVAGMSSGLGPAFARRKAVFRGFLRAWDAAAIRAG